MSLVVNSLLLTVKHIWPTLKPSINTIGGPFLVKKGEKTVLGSNVGFTTGKRGRETQAVASRGQGA